MVLECLKKESLWHRIQGNEVTHWAVSDPDVLGCERPR